MKSTTKCNLGSLNTLLLFKWHGFYSLYKRRYRLESTYFSDYILLFVFLSSSRILLNDRKGTTVFTRLSLHAEIGISMHTAMQQRLQRNVNTSYATHRETCCWSWFLEKPISSELLCVIRRHYCGMGFIFLFIYAWN